MSKARTDTLRASKKLWQKVGTHVTNGAATLLPFTLLLELPDHRLALAV